ncbi:TPA: hypothetical protein N0F65_000563 [Lagenidium giganteum]|uniref:Uncharacterized protein n=1 Tax=Lagenidium giganteum TaxID=4803 RepID=A0AAV2Z4V2_9STRA|nr:TPA: hypothetical protein N0F65_000563 [Lagenidium giganteum]
MAGGGQKRAKDRKPREHERDVDAAVPQDKRAIVWHSHMEHVRSRHAEIVRTHVLTQQVEVVLPSAAGVDKARSLRWETSFYYQVCAPLSMLLTRRFVCEYVAHGSVYMIAKNVAIDGSNSAVLLPSGQLLLLLDVDTYQALGLPGAKYGAFTPAASQSAHKKRSQRYVVTIDLKSPAFTGEDEANALRQRVLHCLDTKFAPLEMLVCAYNERGVTRTIIFGDDDTIERQRIEVNGELTHFQDVMVPLFDQLDASLMDDKERMTELKVVVQGAHEWLGVVANRLEDLLRHEAVEEYVSMFTRPSDAFEFQPQQELAAVRWRGVIATEFCENLLDKLRAAVKASEVPWAAMTVWGVPDVIASGQNAEGKLLEHGYLVNGTNNYTLLLLPGGEYFSIQTLGPHDTTA